MTVEKTYRGIPADMLVHYLVGLGGEEVDEGIVEGDDWRATVEEGDPESIGPTLSLTPVRVWFEGSEAALDDLLPKFEQKAMRAGG